MITPAAAWSSSGGYAAQARHLRVVEVEHAVGERQQRGQNRVLHIGQDQVRDQQPGRPARPGWGTVGRPDTRTAGPSPETDVLHVVPPLGAAGPGRRRRECARSRSRRRTETTHRAGWVSQASKRRRNVGERRSGASQYMRTGRGRPRSSGNSGPAEPEERRRDHHEQEVLHHVDLQQQAGPGFDRRRQGQEDGRRVRRGRRPVWNAVPAPGSRRRRTSQPRR